MSASAGTTTTGGGVTVGVVAVSPPLLQENKINGMATNTNLKYFIRFDFKIFIV
jgi:hypothetical protein